MLMVVAVDSTGMCMRRAAGDAPVSKEERARSYGANVVRSELLAGVNREVTAAALAESLADEHGATLLHPFEDYDVIAGQGSCGVEIADQLSERGLGLADIGCVLIPAVGGGLAAGIGLALRGRGLERQPVGAVGGGGGRGWLYAVEPEGYDDHCRSFAAGEIVPLTASPHSLCDSLQAVAPGRNTFPINRCVA